MTNLAIFYGGYSSEFAISKLSAENIFNSLPNHISPFLVEVTKESWTAIIGQDKFTIDLNDLSLVGHPESKKIETALIFIHGDPGENGKLQAFLEMKDVSFINTGALASQLSFDKWYCNQFLLRFDIQVAKSARILKGQPFDKEKIISDLGLPCFVKPTDAGSSYGITKVKELDAFDDAVRFAFKEGKTVIVESFLKGREVTCAAYRTSKGLKTLPLTEIKTANEYFDFAAKYEGKSEEITPADLPENIVQKIQGLTEKIYQLLNLRSIARVDYMLIGDEPYVIEVNTTPGFSKASIVPQMLTAAGISKGQFWSDIIEVESKH